MSASTECPVRAVSRPISESARPAVVALCLAASLVVSFLADRRPPDSLAVPLGSISPSIAGWTVAGWQSLRAPIFDKLRPTSYLSRIYERHGRQLGLFIAYYAQQRAGETMHSPKSCLPGNGWEIVAQGNTRITLGGKTVELNRYHVQNNGEHMLAIYWYQSRNRVIASEYLGKALLIKDAVMGGYTSGSIVRILLPDDAQGLSEGKEFAGHLIPLVQDCIGR